MSKFKVGDKVKRRITSNGLTAGCIYTVKEVSKSGYSLSIEEYSDHNNNPYPFDVSNFELVSTKEQEIEIVKEWWRKLHYLVDKDDSGLYEDCRLLLCDNHNEEWRDEDCVELVVNMYNSYTAKETEKRKQELIDKKAKLEAELVQINKELGDK
jgi:hypothetical protein